MTAAHELLTFNAARPDHILERSPFRACRRVTSWWASTFVARGVLYALHDGRLYTLELGTGQLTRGRWYAARGVERLALAWTSTLRLTGAAVSRTPRAEACICTRRGAQVDGDD